MSRAHISDLIEDAVLSDATITNWAKLHASTPAPDSIAITRVMMTSGSTVIEMRSQSAVVNVLVTALDTVEEAHRLRVSLASRSRSQLPKGADTGIVPIPELGAILMAGGLDRRIPALGVLRNPDQLDGEVLSLVGDATPAVSLLSHRYGKRAVLRVSGPRRSIILKAYKSRSDLPRRTAAWGDSLHRAGLSPEPISVLDDISAVVWEDLGEVACVDQWDRPSNREVTEAMATLRALHRTPISGLPRHTIDMERALAAAAARKVSILLPRLRPLMDAARRRVLNHAAEALEGNPLSIHRDAHPGQFGRGSVLVDLDTLSLSDPAIDVGNYLAHMSLFGGGTFERAARYQESPGTALGAFHDLSLLRIASQAAVLPGLTDHALSSLDALSR